MQFPLLYRPFLLAENKISADFGNEIISRNLNDEEENIEEEQE